MIRFFIIALVSLASSALAGSKDVAVVEGRIDKIDREQITLLVNGNPVVVPRASIPGYYSVSYNNLVTAYVSSKGFTRKSAKAR